MEHPNRKHIRLKEFNYASANSYFITVCTANRAKIFWENNLTSKLSPAGIIAEEEILAAGDRFPLAVIDHYVIMPDHIHLIITLYDPVQGSDAKTPNVKNLIGFLKARITKKIGKGSIWQKSFYDHIIRNDKDYEESWNYISMNPIRYIDRMILQTQPEP